MIITTAGRTKSPLVKKANRLSESYNFPYIERNKLSLAQLKEKYHDDVLVVGKEKIFLLLENEEEPVFFHPNSAMFRAKRFLKGEKDPLVSIAGLTEGMSFLDCTLGLASDCIIASMAVGLSGKVTGVEGNKLLYLLVKEGLQTWNSGIDEIDLSMRQVKVDLKDHYSFLMASDNNSYDVVYFDPMFETPVKGSNGLSGIKKVAMHSSLTAETIQEAKRVARKRIILKDHWKSERFDYFGFNQIKRKTATFHYGVIEIS
ncbi:class I SAM-dependent methyltransferase [Pseudalkalibacillus caeni]|uniref:Protein-L-IsoD(D-D) O-methyltransferase n=1 Tax=Exobacillus caeni TaxID=2574798 RepID=A0A5R9F3G1_9BACL|nr:class I SAM-dependent methyltransferase [Pseudalkalibacillus caeni]TLS35443.1 hypothetical protein FCL54_20315 [Pseudalkalibacillus caeni]